MGHRLEYSRLDISKNVRHHVIKLVILWPAETSVGTGVGKFQLT